jgi:phosphopantetheinyl transferase
MSSSQATQIRVMPVPRLSETAPATAFLSASEQRLMTNYRHHRRRLEFVAGRLALKWALLETQASAVRISSGTSLPSALLPAARRMQVLPDDDGRPRLWVEDAIAPTQLSIAHAAGWAAAACSQRPIGLDVIDINVPTAVPDDSPWLAEVEPEWRVRLRALLWGLRECLLKAGQISAKNLWSLNDVQAVPTCPAGEIIARWSRPSSLTPLEIQVENKLVAGAFVLLSRSVMLVITLTSAPHPSKWMHIQ